MDLKFYLSLFVRRLPYFLVLLVLGAVVGVVLASILPPRYQAVARLVVESEQIPDDLASSTVRTGAREQLQIIQQRILTRENLLEMANRLDIYAPVNGAAAPQLRADEIVKDLRDRIDIRTRGGGDGRGRVEATLVNVSFSAPSAVLSANVANEVVTLILQENVAMRTGVSGETLDFFVQEVARLDQELSRRGAEILAFKEANKEALPDSLGFRRDRQSGAQERLQTLERDETQLRDRRDRLVSLYEATGQVDGGSSAGRTPEERQLRDLRERLTTSEAVLSPTNPKIRVMRAKITALEQVVAEQIARRSASGMLGDDGEPLSAYDIQLADLDGQLAFLADRRTQIVEEMRALQTSIEATPGNEITLKTLERDFSNVRSQYDQAVKNKAAAETGDIIEALSKGQRISVIEPAIAPREPTSPNRPMVAASGLGGGLALGLGLIVLLELLNTAVRRPVELTSKLGITPFATLPYFRTEQEMRRRRLLMLLAFGLVIVGVPLALWAINAYVTPLDLLIDQMLSAVSLAGLPTGLPTGLPVAPATA